MAINTYATLKDAVQRWSKRNDSLSTIDDFIDLAEADMWKGPSGGDPLRIRDMEARATATASDRFLALPDGFLEMRKLRLVNGSINHDLKFCVPESMTVNSGSGVPVFYTVTSEVEFDRIPASSYTTEMHYYKELTALSSSNTTNAILTRFPDVYLFGCLYHFGLWALDDAFATKYSQLFISAIKAANKTDKKGRYPAGKAMKREGPTP